ncbi:hypothetical protein E8E14_007715 [Neopestalotiopsis sp. 37M]|nr:hypothetical protein E8E14_007715 [Neopestalotiopsis sp. 37M]
MSDITSDPPLTRESVQAAHELIKPFVHRTPVLTNTTLTELASTPRNAEDLVGTPWEGRVPAKPKVRLWFKCENFQKIGAFKVRGAFHAIEQLKKDPTWSPEKGVVTHSSGNHAQALALAARTNGIPAYIVMPSISPPPKIAATRGYGAKIIFSGSTSVEREVVCDQVIQDTGARLVPPYDHPNIVLGQGTLGLELQQDAARMIDEANAGNACDTGRLDIILAPCGGGGMLSGVALSCEGTGIRVFGCEPSFEGADDAKRGFESGQRVENVSTMTIADGLRTPLGKIPWHLIYERRLVENFFSVTEDEIKAALKLVLERFKLVIEPSAAVPLAVALFNEDFRSLVEREAGENGWDVGIVFSGGNLNLEILANLIK